MCAGLAPAYISTVDSGNLAGDLVTLRAALTELTEAEPIVGPSFMHAIEDLADLATETAFDTFVYWPESPDETQLRRWTGDVIPTTRTLCA